MVKSSSQKVPIKDPTHFKSPELLALREVNTAMGIPNIIRIPHYEISSDAKRFFVNNPKFKAKPSSEYDKLKPSGWNPVRITEGNQVLYFIGGNPYFRALIKKIEETIEKNNKHSFIYILAWAIDPFPLLYPHNKSTKFSIDVLLTRASDSVGQIRAMLWEGKISVSIGQTETNKPVGDVINNLNNGAVIFDQRTLNAASHHQKIVVIYDGEELTGYCGGIDIANDRERWHDVQCQIIGPAAYDLLWIFLERWYDHPEHSEIDNKKGELLGWNIKVPNPLPLPHGRHSVQISRTYGNTTEHRGLEELITKPGDDIRSEFGRSTSQFVVEPYKFAPRGEQTIKQAISHAIANARRFIYIEDQYLVDQDICTGLESALDNIQHLTILIPEGITNDAFRWHRREFIDRLQKRDSDKVQVFYHTNKYMHSKLYIIDDELVINGSANCCRRSLSHDSEVMTAIIDQPNDDICSYSFAHRLRIALWAELLNMDTPEGHALLANGVVASGFWRNLPKGANVQAYKYIRAEDESIIEYDPRWNTLIDPDGS